jgi:hypothetical protein
MLNWFYYTKSWLEVIKRNHGNIHCLTFEDLKEVFVGMLQNIFAFTLLDNLWSGSPWQERMIDILIIGCTLILKLAGFSSTYRRSCTAKFIARCWAKVMLHFENKYFGLSLFLVCLFVLFCYCYIISYHLALVKQVKKFYYY